MKFSDIIPHHCLYLDIEWHKFFTAAQKCMLGNEDRKKIIQDITKKWSCKSNPNHVFISLSIRTTLDLFLAVQNFPKGSEIVMSAVNIPDMARVIRGHGLRIVSMDVEIDTLTPKSQYLDCLITDKTVAILVAHVLGKRFNMTPFINAARKHGLFVLEDCAEVFCGFDYVGHPDADLSLFSFGTIKYCTALGGSVAKVKGEQLYERMTQLHANYPVQAHGTYLKKVMKTSVMFVLLNLPRVSKVLWYICYLLTIDFKKHVVKMARGFPDNFFEGIRHQPSTALLYMMLDQFRDFNPSSCSLMKLKGDYVTKKLSETVAPIGMKADVINYWLFPIIVENPDLVVKVLNSWGVDAYHGATQLNVIEPDNGETPLRHLDSKFVSHYPHEAKFLFDHIVYLPVHKDVPFHDLDAICALVDQVTAGHSPSRLPRLPSKL